jgi:hypothetical protein
MKFKFIYIILSLLLFYSCKKNTTTAAASFLKFTIGTKNYEATYALNENDFDDNNQFRFNYEPGHSGSAGFYSLNGWLTDKNENFYDFHVNENYKFESIMVGSYQQGQYYYVGNSNEPECPMNEPLECKLTITKNDNVNNGYIEGSFNGIIGTYDHVGGSIEGYDICKNTKTIKGSFRLKIRKSY